MKCWSQWLGIAILLAAAACRPATPAAAPPTPTTGAAVTEPALPGQLVKFSGDDSAVSDPFHLEVAASVDISWQYSGSGPFALWLVNDTEDLADPSLFRTLIKQSGGASNEATQYRLDPGDYHLEVELADGQWTVLAKAAQ